MNTKRITLIVSSVLLILTLVGCSQASAVDPKIYIGIGDAGKTITLNTGDTLVVTLDGNTTTGYNWLTQPMNPAILKQVGDPVFTPESNKLGAPGKIVLTFQATKIGQANLVLNYKRPFENSSAPLNTFQVTVVVK